MPEDVERPMLRRIRELEQWLAMVEPERRVRDVEASGACFFLCGNLARQDLGRSARTYSDQQLSTAANQDRLAVVALMKERLAVPMVHGDTLEKNLSLLATLEPPLFPGAPTASRTAQLRSLISSVSRRCGRVVTKLPRLRLREVWLGR
mmetsp:Transcript_24909/g.56792  ORF Transcript_24909/g.56792 Transcript_24909/m.56792 type:complete len:149 (+) Transcript_24909:413-859(+)